MKEITLEDIVQLLKKKNLISDADIQDLAYGDKLAFRNFFTGEEAAEIKQFLNERVLQDRKPSSYTSALHYHHVIKPLAEGFDNAQGTQSLIELYQLLYSYRKELSPRISEAMDKAEKYIPSRKKSIINRLL